MYITHPVVNVLFGSYIPSSIESHEMIFVAYLPMYIHSTFRNGDVFSGIKSFLQCLRPNIMIVQKLFALQQPSSSCTKSYLPCRIHYPPLRILLTVQLSSSADSGFVFRIYLFPLLYGTNVSCLTEGSLLVHGQ